MDLGGGDVGVYGLVTELCERLLKKYSPGEQHPYLPKKDTTKTVRKLRSKAYGILINKSPETYCTYVKQKSKDGDPIAELLKHIFVLKVGKKSISQAAELERLLDELIDCESDEDPVVYSTLQLLIGLKSFQGDQENTLDVFHYGKVNPLLPEALWDGKGATPFQIYPMESFLLPDKFEAMLGIKQSCIIQDCAEEPGSRLSFLGRFKSTTTIGIESIRSRSGNTVASMVSSTTKGMVELVAPRDFIMPSYFLPDIVEDGEDLNEDYYLTREGTVTEPDAETPWICMAPQNIEADSVSDPWEVQVSNQCLYEEAKIVRERFTLIWGDVVNAPPVSNYRTWETLGRLEPSKQRRFISETNEAMFHICRIKQANILPLLTKNVTCEINLIKEVSSEKFLSDVRLLLLGVESDCFEYDNLLGFSLRHNLAVPGVSGEALEDVCSDITSWGTSFKGLTILSTPDPQTGKLQQDGLIFKAMCNSIKELLLCYQAAVLRFSINDSPTGLLELQKKARSMGLLINEVARLCRCDRQSQGALDEGLGILTHIYQEVTKVTKPNVALVFYSILKACCEVYFRFLQKWLFEGVCDDIYGEFMIKIRPQYLRHRAHRFWTKGFGINVKSVPGFLNGLAPSILQCGKAVRLLKICDPKNPLCGVFATSHPAVRVCLSVGQLREQQMHCREYFNRGSMALGTVISLSSALQEEREIQKQQAELVNIAQQDTLLRIKREQEESIRQLAQSKRDLLIKLKDQAEEAALRRVRDKEAQLQADKLFLEKVYREQKEEAERVQREKENILIYYNGLATEAEKRRIHADWRIRRMQLFDDRVVAISTARHEIWEMKDNLAQEQANKTLKNETDAAAKGFEKTDGKTEKISVENVSEHSNLDKSVQQIEFNTTLVDPNANPQEDENSNVAENETPTNDPRCLLDGNNSTISNATNTGGESMDDTNKNLDDLNVNAGDAADNVPIKSPRPTVLNITPISLSTEPIEVRQEILNKQAMNSNKNKAAAHSVAFHQGYYEKSGNKKNNLQDVLLDRTGIQKEALANRMRNTASLDAFCGLDSNTDDIDMNNEVVVNRLELLRLRGTDNMTEAQRNRLKILVEEYGMTPNNNESTTILTEGEKNTNCINQSELGNDNLIGECQPDGLSEIQINRNRNTQHRTNQGNQSLTTARRNGNFDLTDAQKNKKRNMTHQTDQGEGLQKDKILNNRQDNLTDAQKNRNRNMEHKTEQGSYVTEDSAKVQNVKITDAQRNRAKVMEQEFHIYGSVTILEKPNEVDSGVGTPMPISSSSSMQQMALDSTTPMSCTTDNFPLSMSSSLSQLQQCIDTPLSETGSDMRSVLTTGEILTADTVRSDVTENGFKFPERAPMFPNFLGFGSAAMTPTSESSLTVTDVEMIDNTSLQVYLEKSVTIPLQIQSRLINDAIIKYLLHEHNLLSHLHSLRSYFFLLNGEFSRTLTNSLYTRLYEVTVPVELLNSTVLNNLLDKALIASLSSSYANSERLSLSANDVPSQLQVSNPEALECLCLNYKISWPLNIIFDEMLMLQYSKVFKFLLMVGRVIWVLQEDFHILKAEKDAANSKQYHRLQLYRHAMMQFMIALHNYLTCSVLHASWSEFEKDLENALTIDQVYLIHISYIKKILFRCMLNPRGEKMRACLQNVFKVILKFHNRVRSQSWVHGSAGYTHPNYSKLEQMYHAFCELRTYLAHVADKLASSGYQPHLTHFLNALNINHLYDLTVKRND